MLLVLLCIIKSFALFWFEELILQEGSTKLIRLKFKITHNAASSLCILRFGEVLPFSSVNPLMFGCWWTDVLGCVQAQVKDQARTLKDIHRDVAKPVLCGLGYLFRLLLGSLIFRLV